MKSLFTIAVCTHLALAFFAESYSEYLAKLNGKNGETSSESKASLVYISFKGVFQCGGVIINVNVVLVLESCVAEYTEADYQDIRVVDGTNYPHPIDNIRVEKLVNFFEERLLAVITLLCILQKSDLVSWLSLPKNDLRLDEILPDMTQIRWNESPKKVHSSNKEPIINYNVPVQFSDEEEKLLEVHTNIQNAEKKCGNSNLGGFLLLEKTLIGVACKTNYISDTTEVVFYYTRVYYHNPFILGIKDTPGLNPNRLDRKKQKNIVPI